jgi:hypothetical protein
LIPSIRKFSSVGKPLGEECLMSGNQFTRCRYSNLVFAVTDIPFKESSQSVTPQEAELWIPHGTQAIPKEIGRRAWTAQFSCTALVYEFIHEQEREPRILLPSDGALSALAHLQGARLWETRLSAVFGLSH